MSYRSRTGLRGLTSRCGRVVLHSGDFEGGAFSWEEKFCLLIPASRGSPCPLVQGAVHLPLKPAREGWGVSLSSVTSSVVHLFLNSPFLPPSSSFKDPSHFIGLPKQLGEKKKKKQIKRCVMKCDVYIKHLLSIYLIAVCSGGKIQL